MTDKEFRLDINVNLNNRTLINLAVTAPFAHQIVRAHAEHGFRRFLQIFILEHEQDIRSYEQKIEQNRLEHEQDIRSYEQKIEQSLYF